MATAGTKPVKRTRPVQGHEPSINQNRSSIKAEYVKNNRGCSTSCGLRLPKRSVEITAVRLIKHLGCKFAKGLCLVMVKKKRRQELQPAKVSSSGRSQPSVIPVDSHRTEAIEDCIEFINSSSSFTRSNSTSAQNPVSGPDQNEPNCIKKS